MKSLVLSIGCAAVLIACDSALSQMPAPARLLPRNAIMLIETPNAQQLIGHLKTDFYDPFYRRAIDEGKLLPLDLTGARNGMKIGKIENRHWLATSVESICNQSFPGAEELLLSMESFVGDKFQISPDEEDAIVAKIARLFPGRLFVGLQDHTPFCTFVFGFEFAPDTFDWFAELKAAAAIQNGNDKAAGFAGDLPIFHLPLEEIYFFSVNNVMYGVSDVSIDSCVDLANRVLTVPEKQDSLEGSRHFARVESSLEYEPSAFDVYCFARVRDFAKLKIRGCMEPDTGQRISADDEWRWLDDVKYWANDVGVSVNFDVEENYFKYRVVWPLLAPKEKVVIEVFDNALGTMDPNKSRLLPPFTYNSFTRAGDMSKFPYYRINALQGGVLHSSVWHDLFLAGARGDVERLDFEFELLNGFDQVVESTPETCVFFEFIDGEVCGLFFDASQSLATLGEFKGALAGILESEANAKKRHWFENSSKYRASHARNLESTLTLADQNNEDAAGLELMKLGVGDSTLAQFGKTLFLLPSLPQGQARRFLKKEFSKEFVLDDWFGGELSKAGDLKAFSLQRSFIGSMAHDGGVFPIHLMFSELSRQNYWSYSGHDFNQRRLDEKRLSFLFQLSRAFGSEIQHYHMKLNLMGEILDERDLPLIYVNTMLIGESKIEYHGLMRSEAKN